jgi:hypothetical protein
MNSFVLDMKSGHAAVCARSIPSTRDGWSSGWFPPSLNHFLPLLTLSVYGNICDAAIASMSAPDSDGALDRDPDTSRI